ncbi:MAG: imidazole glycerol phosphate synthase subunit HisH [Lachnospiraceae bacterium]|nr:imidazole glycerol phosphate synthase subunit HisH [Lachnospiraceae bacterium]
MIAIIDYDAGNIRSVEKALAYLGEEAVLTRDKETILKADKAILPGVGNFKDAMVRIREYGLDEVIHEFVASKKPFLGICLGLQLMFEESEESPGEKGLCLLEGKCTKIPATEELKVPQIGWNSLEFPKESKLFKGIEPGSYVYFVHSYYLKAKNFSDVAATAEYGVTIHAAVEKDNIYACQFHPEKSSDVGLKIIKNFISL